MHRFFGSALTLLSLAVRLPPGFAQASAGSLLVTEDGDSGKAISAILSAFPPSLDVTTLSCCLVVQKADSKYYSAPYPGVVAPVETVGATSFCRFAAWDFSPSAPTALSSLYIYLLKEGVAPNDVIAADAPPDYSIDQALAAVYQKAGTLAKPAPISFSSYPSSANATSTPIAGAVSSLDAATSRLAQNFASITAKAQGLSKALLFAGAVDAVVDGSINTGGSGSPAGAQDGFAWTALGGAADVDASTGRFSFPSWSTEAVAAGVPATSINAFKVLVVPASLPLDSPEWLLQAMSAAQDVFPLGTAPGTSGAATSDNGAAGSSSSSSSSSGLHPALIVIAAAGAILGVAALAGFGLVGQYRQRQQGKRAEEKQKQARKNRRQQRGEQQQGDAREAENEGLELPTLPVAKGGKAPQAQTATESTHPVSTDADDSHPHHHQHQAASGISGVSGIPKNGSQTSLTAAPSEYLVLGSTSVSASATAATTQRHTHAGPQPSSGSSSVDLDSSGLPLETTTQAGAGGGSRSASSLSFIDIHALPTPEGVKVEGAVLQRTDTTHNEGDDDDGEEDEDGRKEGTAETGVAPGAIITPQTERKKAINTHAAKAAAPLSSGLGIQRRAPASFAPSAAPGSNLVAPAPRPAGVAHSATGTADSFTSCEEGEGPSKAVAAPPASNAVFKQGVAANSASSSFTASSKPPLSHALTGAGKVARKELQQVDAASVPGKKSKH